MKQTTYYGNPISEYGLEQGYVDYACLAQAFQHILYNDITEKDPYLYDNIVSGYKSKYVNGETYDEISEEEFEALSSDERNNYYEELDLPEIFQYYIVSENAIDILKDAGEIVFYSEALNLYIWGVAHYGTAWDYVLTDIKINTCED